MHNPFLLLGSLGGLVGVILGAFGAHALKEKLTESQMLGSYETAVHYQLWHALVLLVIGLLVSRLYHPYLLTISGWFFTAGIILFSGSLYLMSLTGVHQFGLVNIGLVTPLGGTCLLIGWALLCVATLRG